MLYLSTVGKTMSSLFPLWKFLFLLSPFPLPSPPLLPSTSTSLFFSPPSPDFYPHLPITTWSTKTLSSQLGLDESEFLWGHITVLDIDLMADLLRDLLRYKYVKQ